MTDNITVTIVTTGFYMLSCVVKKAQPIKEWQYGSRPSFKTRQRNLQSQYWQSRRHQETLR